MAIRHCITRVSHIRKAGTTILAALLLSLLLTAPSRAQSSGSTKWLRTFIEGGGGQSAAAAIDSQGNVYVTGGDGVSSNFCPPPQSCSQAVTIKYDVSGKALWKDWLSTTNPGTAGGMGIALDSAGNAYVLFNVTHQRSSDAMTIPEIVIAKYNPAGGRDWINRIDSSHAVGGVLSTSIQMVVSPAGNVYILYDVASPTVSDTAVTVKYDTAGHFIWSQTINQETGANPGSRPGAIGLDANENVYVTVAFSSTTGTSGHFATEDEGEIVKYNADGIRLASIGRGQISGANGFHVDPDGACYFSGTNAFSPGTTGPGHFIVAKFNPNGSLSYLFDVTQAEGIGGPFAPPSSFIEQITSDSAGDAFVLQTLDQTGPHGDGHVMSVLKLDPLGHELFVTRYNPASDESLKAFPAALAVSPSGDFYVTGNSSPEIPTTSAFVTIKYNSAGVRQWLAQYTGPGQFATPLAMALVGDNLIVTGRSAISNGAGTEWATIDYVP